MNFAADVNNLHFAFSNPSPFILFTFRYLRGRSTCLGGFTFNARLEGITWLTCVTGEGSHRDVYGPSDRYRGQ